MAKAVFIDRHGGPEVFRIAAHDTGPPGPGQVLVRHDAIGLNFIDIYQRKGLYPLALPAILGGEAAGTVEAAGKGVDTFVPGDRVAYLAAGGAYADAALAPAAMAVKLPDGIDATTAAASLLKGLTVQMLVRQVFPLGPDKSALVYAAAGGVGSLLCQWANHLGARVIAVVGSKEKAERVKAYGVKDIIVRTETDDIAGAARSITGGRGVDVVYDSVGAATFEASLDSLALRGMMVSYGNASGPVPPFAPLELSRRGSLSLIRPSLFHYATPDALPAMAEELFSLLGSGVIRVDIGGRFPLAEIAEAHRLLESGRTAGAIVIEP